MLIDSHCHLPHERYNKTVAEIIDSAKKEGVEKFINIGTSLEKSRIAIETAKKFANVYPTVGIYPHEDQDKTIKELKMGLENLLSENPNVVGIGECGIDISNWENGRPVEKQIELFEMQIELAIVHNLPLVIHNRNGDKEVLATIKNFRNKNLRGVVHCFVSNWKFAQKMLDFGLYLSFSGIITYPSGRSILETVEKVPLDRFLVETDSPDLAPQGHRGETNEPKYVRIVAEKVAEIKKLPFIKVCTCAHENTCALFNLDTYGRKTRNKIRQSNP